MRHSLITASLFLSFSLAACSVDTTGLSPESSRVPEGNPDAPVTVMEFADLQCPACKSSHEFINKQLISKYNGNIRFEFKHFPLQALHTFALEAAQASECAADQGKFWDFINLTYAEQDALSSSQLRTWAKKLSLDTALFDRCVRSGIKKDTVLADYALGQSKDVNSTPTYFVNNTKITSNTLEEITAAIDAILDEKRSVPL